VSTLVEVLQPFNGRVYDPCCGSGYVLQSAKFIESWRNHKISLLVGLQPDHMKMAQMNLAIRVLKPTW
jgi:type I restriction enzyme M protein